MQLPNTHEYAIIHHSTRSMNSSNLECGWLAADYMYSDLNEMRKSPNLNFRPWNIIYQIVAISLSVIFHNDWHIYNISTYLISCNVIDGYRAYQSSYCSDAIGHAHQNTGVPWCYIQMIDIVTGNGKATERYTERKSCQCTGLEQNEFCYEYL